MDNPTSLSIVSCNKPKSDDNDYDPFAHRSVAKPNSAIDAVFNLLTSCLGMGILTMPYGFMNAGYVVGIFGTSMVGLLIIYCINMMINTSRKICRISHIPSLDFTETVVKVIEYGPKPLRRFRNVSRHICGAILVPTYFFLCCANIVLISHSLKNVIDNELNMHLDHSVYVGFVVVVGIAYVQIRDLKYLVPFSVAANILMVAVLAICGYFMADTSFAVDERSAFGAWSNVPSFISTAVFALSAIGAVLPIESQMRKPQEFLGCPGVLNVAMGILITMYSAFGFLGYMRYGDSLNGTITLSLPIEHVLAKTVQYLLASAIFCIFGIQFYIFFNIVWPLLQPRIVEEQHNIAQIALRSFSVLVMGIIAVVVPNLETIIGLVGATGFSLMGFFIPAVLDTIFEWPHTGRFHCQLIRNLAIMAFALVLLISGAWSVLCLN